MIVLYHLRAALGLILTSQAREGQNYQSPAKFAAEGIILEAHEYRPMPYSLSSKTLTPTETRNAALKTSRRAF
jgi:hypothetical protein